MARAPRRPASREAIRRDLETAIERVAAENRELTAALAAWASIAAQIEVQFPRTATLSAALAKTQERLVYLPRPEDADITSREAFARWTDAKAAEGTALVQEYRRAFDAVLAGMREAM